MAAPVTWDTIDERTLYKVEKKITLPRSLHLKKANEKIAAMERQIAPPRIIRERVRERLDEVLMDRVEADAGFRKKKKRGVPKELPSILDFFRASIELGRTEYVKAMVASGDISGEILNNYYNWALSMNLVGCCECFWTNLEFCLAREAESRRIGAKFAEAQIKISKLEDELRFQKEKVQRTKKRVRSFFEDERKSIDAERRENYKQELRDKGNGFKEQLEAKIKLEKETLDAMPNAKLRILNKEILNKESLDDAVMNSIQKQLNYKTDRQLDR